MYKLYVECNGITEYYGVLTRKEVIAQVDTMRDEKPVSAECVCGVLTVTIY